jgi:hypothetical protein
MKKLIALLFLTLVSIPPALAADAPVIVIRDAGNCYVDGMNVGAPADAIANNPAIAPQIQLALDAYNEKVKAEAKARAEAKAKEDAAK